MSSLDLYVRLITTIAALGLSYYAARVAQLTLQAGNSRRWGIGSYYDFATHRSQAGGAD